MMNQKRFSAFLGLTVLSLMSAANAAVLDTPVLSCESATYTTLGLRVDAGSTGTPNGLTLEWMRESDFQENNDFVGPTACKASFPGVFESSKTRFSLASNAATIIETGKSFEPGVTSNCTQNLECGIFYVFRASANADSTYALEQSLNTDVLKCATWACPEPSSTPTPQPTPGNQGCTYTQGYWKNYGHGPKVKFSDRWPTSVVKSGLSIGNVTYTAKQLLAILNSPVRGNGLIALAHQIIAAKLNIASGANADEIKSDLAEAESLIGSLVIPPVGSGKIATSATSSLTESLADFNEGITGPGHCQVKKHSRIRREMGIKAATFLKQLKAVFGRR